MKAIFHNDFSSPESLEKEWLLTGRNGDYASSTIIGCNIRKYHGLLVADLVDPPGRFVLLSTLEESLCDAGQEEFFSSRRHPDVYWPRGHEFLESMEMENWPVFRYVFGQKHLTREIRLLPDRPVVLIRYHLEGAARSVSLKIKPLLALRSVHTLRASREDTEILARAALQGIRRKTGSSRAAGIPDKKMVGRVSPGAAEPGGGRESGGCAPLSEGGFTCAGSEWSSGIGSLKTSEGDFVRAPEKCSGDGGHAAPDEAGGRGMPSALYFRTSCSGFAGCRPDWYYAVTYPREAERGYPSQEDLLMPGVLELPLGEKKSIILAVSTERVKGDLRRVWNSAKPVTDLDFLIGNTHSRPGIISIPAKGNGNAVFRSSSAAAQLIREGGRFLVNYPVSLSSEAPGGCCSPQDFSPSGEASHDKNVCPESPPHCGDGTCSPAGETASGSSAGSGAAGAFPASSVSGRVPGAEVSPLAGRRGETCPHKDTNGNSSQAGGPGETDHHGDPHSSQAGSRRETGMLVVAGFHWFGAWGRDTLIALPGLTFAAGRNEAGRAVLRTVSQAARNGLIPNLFALGSRPAAWNSVDASLWYVWAVQQMDFWQPDEHFMYAVCWPVIKDIVTAFRTGIVERGKRIAYIEDNGLLHAGDERTQLTWMDASIDNVPVTPRHGCPVELSALWYNALVFSDRLAQLFGEEKFRCPGEIQRLRDVFSGCFRTPPGWFGDVWRDGVLNTELRPNQLFALSVPCSPVSVASVQGLADALGIMAHVRDKLLTPYGLRTLSPDAAGYHGCYGGSPAERDSAYHQGTVWPWLLGAYADALVKTARALDRMGEKALPELSPVVRDPAVLRFTISLLSGKSETEPDGGKPVAVSGQNDGASPSAPGSRPQSLKTSAVDHAVRKLLYAVTPLLTRHFQDAGLGSLSEIFDGAWPHAPHGCIAQAWSVAECLRALRVLQSASPAEYGQWEETFRLD